MKVIIIADRLRDLIEKELRDFRVYGSTYAGCRIPIGRIDGVDVNLEITREQEFDRRPAKLVCVQKAKGAAASG